MVILARQDNLCDQRDFQANTDFYGFGIRLGVYLQWFSSWLSNTLDPDAASENHEENSIFVLAIAIALVLAFQHDDLKVSEAYILMLICTGYFALVVSTWGIRLHFLRPKPVHVSPLFWHGNRVDSNVRTTRLSKLPGGQTLNAIANHYLSPRQMPLSQSGSVKPTGLSWAGAVWRSNIALFVIALNLYLWFSYDPDIQDADPNCRPIVYFFGSQELTNGLRIFFIVVLLIVGIVIFQLLLQMLSVVYFLIIKCMLGPLFDLLGLRRLKYALLDLIHRRLQLANHSGIVPSEEITFLHVRSALFALCARKPAPGTASHVQSQGHHEKGYRLSMALVLTWHVFLLTMMALFICFIEMTIQINNMQGAFVIRSTSQLIPFVIGLISMLNTIRELLLEWYEEDHPNDENTHFVITGSMQQMSLLGMVIGMAMKVTAWLTGGKTTPPSRDDRELGDLPIVETPASEGSHLPAEVRMHDTGLEQEKNFRHT